MGRAVWTIIALVGLMVPGAWAQTQVAGRSAAFEPDARLGADLGEEDPTGLVLEALSFRFSYMVQEGKGFQSQDGASGEPGNEALTVVQPMGSVVFRQSPRVSHQIIFPVDLVTSASADAVDAISQASRVTEAGKIDVTTTYEPNEEHAWTVRYGSHFEETTFSFFLGLGFRASLADDNATLSLSGLANVDLFDRLTHRGFDTGVTSRASYNGNVGFTQILSPTTIASVSYGLTLQTGTLQTTWNAVPLAGTDRFVDEKFPNTRFRHAAAMRLAQHVPWSRSTLKAGYRFYVDSFDLQAHTVDTQFYQYLLRTVYVRGSYRYHTQDGVDFFHERIPVDFDLEAARTSDSDLAPLHAHEFGLKLVFLLNPARSAQVGSETFDISYLRYQRSNDLHMDVFSLGWGGTF